MIALVRHDVAAIQDLPLKKMQGDVLNRESLIAFMQTCDAVIHTAAAIDLSYRFNQKVYDINVTGTYLRVDIEQLRICGLGLGVTR